jgi:hypothetical protein
MRSIMDMSKKKVLLVITGLLTANYTIAYAHQDLSLMEDFEMVNSASLKQVKYGLSLPNDIVKTGITAASLVADGNEILAKGQQVCTRALTFDIEGVWKDVEKVVGVGKKIGNKLQQIPDALNKATLHKARLSYYLDEVKSSNTGKAVINAVNAVEEQISTVASTIKKTALGWFGW